MMVLLDMHYCVDRLWTKASMYSFLRLFLQSGLDNKFIVKTSITISYEV
jgi:hypothetical protein